MTITQPARDAFRLAVHLNIEDDVRVNDLTDEEIDLILAPANDAAKAEQREADARKVEKRAEDRFAEYGTREPDTNATYYSGRYGETLEALDEEDEAIAAAIRASGKS